MQQKESLLLINSKKPLLGALDTALLEGEEVEEKLISLVSKGHPGCKNTVVAGVKLEKVYLGTYK